VRLHRAAELRLAGGRDDALDGDDLGVDLFFG
jgi:hypothetical protein